jgi:hypothetical protein
LEAPVENTDIPPERAVESHGIILGPLRAHLLDRIQVGDLLLLLPDGTTCDHPIGTVLQVTYTEHEGIKQASRVVRAMW